MRVIHGSTYKLHGTGFVDVQRHRRVDLESSRHELAEISASTGNFIQDVKIKSLGLTQVNTLTSTPRTCGRSTASTNTVVELDGRSGVD